MKQNYEICLVSSKVVLVPYRPEHVPKYHEWMKDPHLLEATGSEPLSYEEECEMQESWRDDDSKCTFIVHQRHPSNEEKCDTPGSSVANTRESEEADSDANFQGSFDVKDHLDEMIGDVNLFLSVIEEDEDETDGEDQNRTKKEAQRSEDITTNQNSQEGRIQAEIDIMIAEKSCQGQGLGRASVCAMLLYGYYELNVERFFCKINEDNISSIKLFESLGFKQCDYAACFKQVEMELLLERPSSSRESHIDAVDEGGITAASDSLIGKFQLYGGYTKISCPPNPA